MPVPGLAFTVHLVTRRLSQLPDPTHQSKLANTTHPPTHPAPGCRSLPTRWSTRPTSVFLWRILAGWGTSLRTWCVASWAQLGQVSNKLQGDGGVLGPYRAGRAGGRGGCCVAW